MYTVPAKRDSMIVNNEWWCLCSHLSVWVVCKQVEATKCLMDTWKCINYHFTAFITHMFHKWDPVSLLAGCCSMLRKLNPNKQVHYSNEGEVTAVQRVLASSERTDPNFVRCVKMHQPHRSSSQSLSWPAVPAVIEIQLQLLASCRGF